MDPLVLLLGDVCQPLHQELCHLIHGGRHLKLLTEQQSLDLSLQTVPDFLVCNFRSRIHELFRKVAEVLLVLHVLRHHLARHIGAALGRSERSLHLIIVVNVQSFITLVDLVA